MIHSKVDQAIKIGIGVLTMALAFVIVYTMQDHIVNEGDRAPNFRIVTDSGKQISPRDFGGKVLVLNFWASWCGPCVQEAPSLSEFQKQLASSGVVVLGISVDRKENLYQNFIKHFQLPFQTARDPEENISAMYGTARFPESYIIDRNGKVVRKYAGLPERNGQAIPWTDPELVGYVKSLL
jgi:cytochrome c biogenesis protein CcmG, thiol:disulfide interchange protein DsbE